MQIYITGIKQAAVILPPERRSMENIHMENIPLIIFYNHVIDEAKKKHDAAKACKILQKLRRIEIKERAGIGAYRFAAPD